VGSVDKVPLLAEAMVTKWSYEALVVHQFKDNEFEKMFYPYEKRVSIADFKQVHLHGELMKRYEILVQELDKHGKITQNTQKLLLIKNEIEKEGKLNPRLRYPDLSLLTPEKFNFDIAGTLGAYLDQYKEFYSEIFNKNNAIKEEMVEKALATNADLYNRLKNEYHNEAISDLAKKVLEKKKILEYDNQLVQQIDPVFMDPTVTSLYSWRSHFLAPRKFFFGSYYDTFYYNMIVIWVFTGLLYVALYFELIRKLFDLFGKIRFKAEKNG
jgi:hypothetical protein